MKNYMIVALLIFSVAQVRCMHEIRRNLGDIRSEESGVIYKLKPQFFDYGTAEKIPGFDPEVVAKIDPKLVIFSADKKPLHVDYSSLEVFMIKEIQKHQEEIQKLRQEIEQLKSEKIDQKIEKEKLKLRNF